MREDSYCEIISLFSLDNTERIELIKHSIELYTQCFDDGIIASEFEQFIEAAISNFFPNNVFEIVHSDIVCNIKDNTRVDALHEICRRIINKYKQCNIPTFLVTDFLLQQASLFFETEFSKYIKGEKSEVLEGYLYVSQDYQFFRLSGSTCDALFCSDYLIDVKLKGNNFPICRIIDKSLKFFFKNTVRQLSEYKSLCKISPTLSLFTLPSVFNYCDYEDAVSYIKKLERKIESFEGFKNNLNDLIQMNEILIDEYDEELGKDLIYQTELLSKKIENLELETLLSGKYDGNNAILTLHPGAGRNRIPRLGSNVI